MQQGHAPIVLGVLLVISPIALFAQSQTAAPASVPRVINISGVFRPADGQPPGSVETVTFAIYAEQEGGTPLWEETQTAALDTAGRYTLLLGATHPDGIPAVVFASGEAQWLGTRFERAGEVEGPRLRITSVPYALRASDAETLGGLPASAYLLAPSAGHADARAGSSAADDKKAPGSSDIIEPGTTNFLSKYTNSMDLGNSAVFESNGLVGIGTTAPLDSLHLRFTNVNGSATGLAVQNLSGSATAYSGMLFYDHNGVLGQFQGFNNTTHEYRINNIARTSVGGPFNGSINFMIGGASRFFISSGLNGNVGIGTSAPGTSLEVSNALSTAATANVSATSFTGTNAVGSLFVGRKARGTATVPTAALIGDTLGFFGATGFGTTGFSTTSIAGMTVRAAQQWTDTAQGSALLFSTTPNGTVVPRLRMTIDAFGGIGIGTPVPSGAMEVFRNAGEGDAQVFATTFDGESAFVARAARGNISAPAALQSGDQLGIYAMSGYATTGFGAGIAGIAGLAAENWTDTAQGSALVFATTPLGTTTTEIVMSILPSGNVGIGTPPGPAGVPTALDRLQVFGDVRVGTTGTEGCLKNFAGTGIVGVCSSDRRLKRNITPFRPVLGQLTALQPVHYFWRTADFPQRHFGTDQAYGLIAQDVERVLPELIVTDKDGYQAVDYSKLPLLTIQAVKELKAENDALKHRVSELERLITEALASAARR